MEYPKNFKKDVKNILGITVDLRKKEFKELGKEAEFISMRNFVAEKKIH